MSADKEMSFLDHLEELRWRLVKSAIAIILIAAVLWNFQEWIMENVFLSLRNKDFITYQKMCEWFGVCSGDVPIQMQSQNMSGQFSYSLVLSLMGGFVGAFPFVFYQVWCFIKPGLKQNEVSISKGIIFYVSVLFFLGILFGYFVVAPLCVQFFGTYKISEEINNIFTVNSYLSTILSTVFYSGLLFLLPVVSFLLTKLGIINAAFLRKYRKHAIVAVLILSAVITPPDLISQVIVAIPIAFLYEVGIIVSSRAEKKRNAENAA
ncbi:twin-arginine translocase subunit TatC [Crocinitomicaceae bacterium]|nr:twin-arginine translocase subunit TatC [Crocinitomicaceae bacterium]